MKEFYKVQSAGNDFVLVEVSQDKVADLNGVEWREFVKRCCVRKIGIGADGVLVVYQDNNGWNMRIFNADGTEAEMCGNGLACVAHFLRRVKRVNEEQIEINTLAGKQVVKVEGDVVEERIAYYSLEAKDVPYTGDGVLEVVIDGEKKIYELDAVSVGNPHAVFIVDDFSDFEFIGKMLQNHPHFPEKVNVEFVKILKLGKSECEVKARVWERGVGETLSCGTGTVAIGAALNKRFGVDRIKVDWPGGVLEVRFSVKDVYLILNPRLVYRGEFMN